MGKWLSSVWRRWWKKYLRIFWFIISLTSSWVAADSIFLKISSFSNFIWKIDSSPHDSDVKKNISLTIFIKNLLKLVFKILLNFMLLKVENLTSNTSSWIPGCRRSCASSYSELWGVLGIENSDLINNIIVEILFRRGLEFSKIQFFRYCRE